MKEVKKGKFVVIEGVGGCGKDTQVRMLAKFLKRLGKQVVVTREHTRNTPPGKLIEAIIKKRKAKIDLLAMMLLYTCDRRNHDVGVIKPALELGKIVIGNRYYPSSVAYGPKEWREYLLKTNQSMATRPDLVIILNLDPTESVKRVEVRKDADIFDKVEKLKKCLNGYKWYSKNSGDPCVWIDASKSKEEISEEIKKEMKKKKII